MSRFIVTTLTLVTGFFAVMFGLLLAIPLTLVAIITGKRIEKQLKRRPFNPAQNNANVIEGEFEEITDQQR
ncbi:MULTISPECIES: FxsA family protein [Vibrio]|uniref:Hydroxylamine reductase n=1 Tax=Vibrio ostreae TaxID=2841925 RepID=A0A975U6I7_9VIBR|nr:MULTISPECIES: hypothetical protein [Vibrio]QXO15486.1 hypothetical protein KNV97_03425 [Vibrio ostreae]WGY45433.1 hypothetical protein J0X00_00855 [Vibrio sp. ABG19]